MPVQARLLAGVLIAGALAACSSTPVRPKPGPLPALPGAPVVLQKSWSVRVGDAALPDDAVALRPATAGAVTLAASADGVLTAIGDDGKVLWRDKTGLALTGGVAAGYGRVAAGTVKGQLGVWQVSDGKPVWTANLSAAVLAPPAITADKVIVKTNDGRVTALDALTGKPSWTYDTPVPALSLRGYAPPLVHNDLLLVPTSVGKVVALAADTGIGQWEVQVAAPKGRTEIERLVDIDGDLAVTADGKLVVAGYQGQLSALQLGEHPDPLWDIDTSSLGGVAVDSANAYFADTDGKVRAVDLVTGKVIRKQEALAWRQLSNVVLLGDALAVGDEQGYLHLLSSSDGRILGRARTRGPVTRLEAVNGRLLASTRSGTVSTWRLER